MEANRLDAVAGVRRPYPCDPEEVDFLLDEKRLPRRRKDRIAGSETTIIAVAISAMDNISVHASTIQHFEACRDTLSGPHTDIGPGKYHLDRRKTHCAHADGDYTERESRHEAPYLVPAELQLSQ